MKALGTAPRGRASRLAFGVGLVVLAAANQAIPVRDVPPPEAASARLFGYRVRVRELSDGSVQVLDLLRPRITKLDAHLGNALVVADERTLEGSPQPIAALSAVGYAGDSTLVLDRSAGYFLVLDRDGRRVRTMALPHPEDWRGPIAPGTAFDREGRLIYRGAYRPSRAASGSATPQSLSVIPDSFPLVRADLEARTVDTLAVLRTVGDRAAMTNSGPRGAGRVRVLRQPLPTIDDWAVMADGAVAIVRGRDYHVDWIRMDGTRASTPKLPFDWRRLTDADKSRLVDSLLLASRRLKFKAESVSTARGIATRPDLMRDDEFVPMDEIPSYYPPIRANSVVADRDNNLWVLPTTSAIAGSGLVYDVINNQGRLFERVRLPAGCALAGFGLSRAVYMACPAPAGPGDSAVAQLRRTRLRD